MNWGRRNRKPNVYLDKIRNFLGTEIDLSAEINMKMTVEEAIRTATTKYYCIDCQKRIPYFRTQKYDYQCKICYLRSHPKSETK